MRRITFFTAMTVLLLTMVGCTAASRYYHPSSPGSAAIEFVAAAGARDEARARAFMLNAAALRGMTADERAGWDKYLAQMEELLPGEMARVPAGFVPIICEPIAGISPPGVYMIMVKSTDGYQIPIATYAVNGNYYVIIVAALKMEEAD